VQNSKKLLISYSSLRQDSAIVEIIFIVMVELQFNPVSRIFFSYSIKALSRTESPSDQGRKRGRSGGIVLKKNGRKFMDIPSL
jgi:hypothetical protein